MITRNRILFAIGVWTVLLPFLGFPSSYKTFFVIVSGLAVVLLAFLYARDKRLAQMKKENEISPLQRPEVVTEVYAENQPSWPVSHNQ